MKRAFGINRLFAVLAAAALILAALTGCGGGAAPAGGTGGGGNDNATTAAAGAGDAVTTAAGGGDDAAATTTAAAGGDAAAAGGDAMDGEPVSFTATYAHFGGIPTEGIVGQEWLVRMQENLGVTLDITWNFIPYAEYAEKTNVVLAANDISDLHFIMSRATVAPYEDQGIFADIGPYIEDGTLENYKAYLDNVKFGMEKISTPTGSVYGFFGGELPRLSQGVALYRIPAVRWDTFEELGLEVPTTVDELFEVASVLKETYPDIYPVTTNVGHNTLYDTYKTAVGIYYDGSAYQFGPLSDNYKAYLTTMNRLYAEKLLDPEAFNEDADTHTKKVLNGSNYISLGEWFNYGGNWSRNTESEAVWANILAFEDGAYGEAWWGAVNVNEQSIAYNGEGSYIKEGTAHQDIIMKLCDQQYTEETIRLITWGIEGTTYTLKEDGVPTFVDSIRESENMWLEGDKFGMRTSSKFRPGLQGPIDTRAFVDCAPLDNMVIDGEYRSEPFELAFPDVAWPTSTRIPPNVFAPPIRFSSDESSDNANIMTAVNTYVTEESMKFISGTRELSEFAAFTEAINGMNIQQVLDMYNAKAAEYQ